LQHRRKLLLLINLLLFSSLYLEIKSRTFSGHSSLSRPIWAVQFTLHECTCLKMIKSRRPGLSCISLYLSSPAIVLGHLVPQIFARVNPLRLIPDWSGSWWAEIRRTGISMEICRHRRITDGADQAALRRCRRLESVSLRRGCANRQTQQRLTQCFYLPHVMQAALAPTARRNIPPCRLQVSSRRLPVLSSRQPHTHTPRTSTNTGTIVWCPIHYYDLVFGWRTKSPAVAKIADRTGCQWPSRSSKVDDF